jgi:hypothetical protein
MLSVLILNLLPPSSFLLALGLERGARSAIVAAHSMQMKESLNKSFQGEVEESRRPDVEIKDYRQIRPHWAGMERV